MHSGYDRSSGYHYVWARDNVHVGWAQFVTGNVKHASDVARALLTFYSKYRTRLEAIITGVADPDDPGQRPHVRFDGDNMAEISSQRWPHAQNDALGYVLWYSATLLRKKAFTADLDTWETLSLFPRYFEAIRYWDDEDSGHWEEVRKVSASSIGVVIAGLEAWLALVSDDSVELPVSLSRGAQIARTTALAERGRMALQAILPHECVQPSPTQGRDTDAALLFLLQPLGILPQEMETRILVDCEQRLKGKYGFRRYVGDSYWAPDYDLKLPPGDRTRDFSDDIAARNALLPSAGQEAQWCIFDSVISAYFGSRYHQHRDAADRDIQAAYLNRALRQVTAGDEDTPPWRCPELYYLRRGVYAPNPHVPLQWAQANLLVALHVMRRSAEIG